MDNSLDLKIVNEYKPVVVLPALQDYKELTAVTDEGCWEHVSSTPFSHFGNEAIFMLFKKSDIVSIEL